MEKQVSELISKIMDGKNSISVSVINETIELHKDISNKKYEYQRNRDNIISDGTKKVNDLIFGDEQKVEIKKPIDNSYIFDMQIKRLEMALRDKLKQINIYLSEEYLDNLENILFHRYGGSDIKDIRLINKNEVAIIRENSIEVGDELFDANNLSAGLSLQEEAYLTECSRLKGEPSEYPLPEEVFSSFYKDIKNKIELLKIDLNILDKDVDLYFDEELDSFYFYDLKTFNAVVVEMPDKIEIYNIEIKDNKWIPKKINGSEIKNIMDKIDFSLIEENIMFKQIKEGYKGKIHDLIVDDFDIEMILEKYKKEDFDLEKLIHTYNSLFKNDNCMFEEEKTAINRLMYLTAEKLVIKGLEYEKAFNYSKLIFFAIEEYKKHILRAINGENKFPEDSLIGIVKKLKYTDNK